MTPDSAVARRLSSDYAVVVARLCVLFACTEPAFAQGSQPTAPQVLNENCVVSVLNRNVQANPDGTWILPNVPANFGPVRARATCVIDGRTVSGESAPFVVPTNGVVNIPEIVLGVTTPIPTALTISAPATTLTAIGGTVQLSVNARYPDGAVADVTTNPFLTYTVSNPAIATLSDGGLVWAAAGGTVIVQATLEGANGMIAIRVAVSGVDTDVDGIPDDAELGLGLDPNNPVDALEDFDRDDLANKDEYLLGTQLRNADTDGDALTDGQELARGTAPLLADTDGDRIPDGIEVQTSTDPLNPGSRDLRAATGTSTVRPASFQLSTSVLFPNASQLVTWNVTLIDGQTTLNLTNDPLTTYQSSDVTICNFGASKGQIFAGQPGTCLITITNTNLSATASGTVQSFTPTALSFVDIPGFANNVAVSGGYAHVAAGAAGLQVVDVSDRVNPIIVGSRLLPGNANDVAVVGNHAYVAAGAAGLQIVNVGSPTAPSVDGALNFGDVAWDVVVSGNYAYVANGPSGLVIVDVSDPTAPVIAGRLSLLGTAKGLAVDPVRKILTVASGTAGISIVDANDPSAPTLLATLGQGDVRDVVLSDTFAFLADSSRSFTAVDLTNPAAPVLTASIPAATGGLLQDVAVNGTVAAGADVFFVNGVPLIDVGNPASPQPRVILDFSDFRDDNGTGVAMDASHVYLTAESGSISENGVNGTTRLYIGQYRRVEDNNGIPPTVQITSPASATQVVQGSAVTVTATATDDVAVAAVTFYLDGQIEFIATGAPYRYTFTVPQGASIVTLGVTAVDFGNNSGAAPNVSLSVIPDPLTTVIGRVMDETGTPLEGATVTTAGLTSSTGVGGSFSLSGVPTTNDIIVRARFTAADGTVFEGSSPAAAPVRAGITNVGTIVVRSAVYLQTWEAGLGGWVTTQPRGISLIQDSSAPSPTTVQQITDAGSGGMYFSPVIRVEGGRTYCLTVWIRWIGGGWPFVGIDKWNDIDASVGFLGENWLIGAAGYPTGFDDTVAPVPSNTTEWNWYAKTFTLGNDVASIRIKNELWFGASKGGANLADFDSIAILDGACPAGPPGF